MPNSNTKEEAVGPHKYSGLRFSDPMNTVKQNTHTHTHRAKVNGYLQPPSLPSAQPLHDLSKLFFDAVTEQQGKSAIVHIHYPHVVNKSALK